MMMNGPPSAVAASRPRQTTTVTVTTSTTSAPVTPVDNVYTLKQPKLCCIAAVFDTQITIDVPQGSLTFEVIRGVCCRTACCSAGSVVTTSLLDVVDVDDNFAQTCSWIMAMAIGFPLSLLFAACGFAIWFDVVVAVVGLEIIISCISWALAAIVFAVAIYSAVRCASVHL